jgi:sugar phosphate isomerase/epimerase
MQSMTRRTFLERAGVSALALAGAPLADALAADAAFYRALGVCTGVGRAAELKAMGAEYVEEGVRRFLVPEEPEAVFEQKLKVARAAPLPVPSCNSFLPGSIRTTGPDLDMQKVLAYADTAFRRAKQAGVKVIVFGSSGSRRLADGFPREEAEAQFVDVLKGMGPLAEAREVTVVVEPLRYQECNFLNTVRQGAAIVEKVNHPHVRLLADLYHMQCNGETPEDLAAVVKLVKHTHIAEKEGRTAPGVHGDDFRPFFRVLRDGGYRGRMSIEGKWKDDTLARGFEVIREQAAS